MVVLTLDSQGATIVSTSVILVLSSILAYLMTSRYLSRRELSTAYWSIGLWMFAFSVLEEVLFAAGIYGAVLIKAYLALVAILVQFLAMGSLNLLKKPFVMNLYYIYSAVTSVFLVSALAFSSIGNVISGFVVFGALPLLAIVASSLITFPAAIILVVAAALSYRKTGSHRMVSIIAGVVVVSAAGTLYIAAYPAFLYLAEFIGILLLWSGFIDFRHHGRPRTSEA